MEQYLCKLYYDLTVLFRTLVLVLSAKKVKQDKKDKEISKDDLEQWPK